MSESDTNPQRFPEPDDAYQRPTSELPNSAPDGRQQPVGDFPPGAERATPEGAPPADRPASDQPASDQPTAYPPQPYQPTSQPYQPTSQPYQPTSGQPGYGQPASYQPAPGQPTSGQPMSGQPMSGQPMSGQPMSGQPASGPDDQTAPQPPIWQPSQAQTSAAPATPPGGYQQGTWYGAPGQQHPYGQQQPATSGQPGGGRAGRAVATGLLALLLAGGGGVIGGLVVHAADSNSTTSTGVSSSSHTAAPTVDRSSLTTIVNNVKDSVVSIQTSDAEGSGVVITSDGFIVTNNHVVADATGNAVQVTLSDGKTVKATIVGTDPKTDLAVVKAQGVSGLTAAKFGDSDSVQVGDTVLAIGSPLGLSGSVTAGIVSALHRTIQESASQPQSPLQGQQQQQQQPGTNIAGAIQTDAAINPGNSGGALVNTNSEVVGINTAIATSSGGDGNIGVGFAIPGNRVNEVAQALMKGQKVSHPFIGIGVGTADGGAGASVASVVSGSPAEKAGLKQGDVIVKANNKDIHSGDDLLNVVQSSKVGDKLQFTVSRGGSTQTVAVTVGESS